jgi:GcrA cell cycle regulator
VVSRLLVALRLSNEGAEAMTWTDERTDRLRELHAEGHSCGYIARDIGGITRNAVIGKIHRLGLHRLGSANAIESSDPPRRRVADARSKRVRKVIRNANGFMVMDIAMPISPIGSKHDGRAIPKTQRKSLVELRDRDCRFPFGEPGHPGFFFCGALAVTTLPYCAQHCSIAYAGIPARRR